MFEPWARLPVRFAADFVHRTQHSVCIALLRYIQGNGRVLSGCALLQSTRFILSRAVLIILFVRGDIAHGQQPEAGSDAGKQWAIVVAVQNHDDPRLNNIRFTQNDALELRRILMERAGVPGRQVIELIDESPAQRRPTLDQPAKSTASSLVIRLRSDRTTESWFTSAATELWWTGRLILCPPTPALQNRKESCYPVQELHDLSKILSPASGRCWSWIVAMRVAIFPNDYRFLMEVTWLIAVNVDDSSRMRGDGQQFAAGSKAWNGPHGRQGLFSYWFCKGLEGGADLKTGMMN
jgi:hypothetical protein